MTTTRALPPDEWFKLEGTLLEQAWPSFDPESDIVLVVEEDGVIVGTWKVRGFIQTIEAW